MKKIIGSDDEMRDEWVDLVQVEAGDPAVRMVENCHDWFQHWPEGKYLICAQRNNTGAIISYFDVSQSFVEKLLKMETIEGQYQAMRRYIAP
jgi:hypothetical protein